MNNKIFILNMVFLKNVFEGGFGMLIHKNLLTRAQTFNRFCNQDVNMHA
jgi:hypothetical protein